MRRTTTLLAVIPCHPWIAKAGILFNSRILDGFASKVAGGKLMRIPLVAPEQNVTRERLRKRVTEIDVDTFAEMKPFTEVGRGAAGKVGLVSWREEWGGRDCCLTDVHGHVVKAIPT